MQKIKKNQTYLYPTPSLIPIWYKIGMANCPRAAVTEPEPLIIPVTVPKALKMNNAKEIQGMKMRINSVEDISS